MNSSRFLVTAKIETPKEVRMSTDLDAAIIAGQFLSFPTEETLGAVIERAVNFCAPRISNFMH